MRFGIYTEMQTAPGKSHAEMTWEILRQIEHADQVGFDVYSVMTIISFKSSPSRESPCAIFRRRAAHGADSLSRGAVHTPTRKPDAAGRPNRRS